MADLPTSFWGGWITVLTVVSLAGLTWFLFSLYFGSGDVHDQEHVVWDENLNEGTHPAPLWWFWLILAAMIFSVIYLMLYPGLGTYRGALQWSQGHRLEQSYEHFNDNYAALRQSILSTSIEELQQDEFMLATGRSIFDRNCAGCHGREGGGNANRFPNLLDDDWQWGGSVAQLEQTIRHGRTANMPAWGATINEQGIVQIVRYIRALGQSTAIPDDDAGKLIYNQYCIGCHTADAKGNPMLGAPSLTDAIWLYGGDDASITETIRNGRNGVMPAFEDRLDDVQIHLLIVWLTRRAG